MRFKPQKYRSFLLRGTASLATTLLLFAGLGCYNSESTGSNAEQPTTITTTTATTTSSSTTTSKATTTTTSTTTTSTTTSETTTTVPATTTTVIPATTAIVTEPKVIETQPAVRNDGLPVSSREYELLCKIVASEYGGMRDVYERAKIVASVMNQSYRTKKSIESCLYASCVPWGFNPNNTYYCGVHYTAMSDAVDYYFANRNTVFKDWQADSWYASGYGTNIFHRQLW